MVVVVLVVVVVVVAVVVAYVGEVCRHFFRLGVFIYCAKPWPWLRDFFLRRGNCCFLGPRV